MALIDLSCSRIDPYRCSCRFSLFHRLYQNEKDFQGEDVQQSSKGKTNNEKLCTLNLEEFHIGVVPDRRIDVSKDDRDEK